MIPPHKHRFETLWGHDGARSMIPRLMAAGRLPHAILLTGPDAIGKRSLAFAMAKAILSAGLPTPTVSVDAPAPARARRKVPDEPTDPEPQNDLFGESEPDLFGDAIQDDLFGASQEEQEEAAPPPPPPLQAPLPVSPEPPPSTKSKGRKGSTSVVAKPTGQSAVPRARFRGYDERICRMVESGYPPEYDKDGRPASLSHPDLYIVEPIGGRRGIVVDQMRALQGVANLPPIEGAFRVVLIFGADTITQEGGNSALKLLEEPPRYLIVILVADRLEAVLPTIRSRCTVVPMTPLDRETLEEKLVEVEGLDRQLARVAASLSEGRPGVALLAVAASLLERRRAVFDARLQIDRFGESAVPAAAARIQSSGGLDESLWLLMSYARDRLVRKCAPDAAELLIHADAMDHVDGGKTDELTLSEEADRLIAAYDMLRHPFVPNQRAALQMALWPE